MGRKSISNRIRVTKNGKILRRAMSLGHSRSNKSRNQMRRKANPRKLDGFNLKVTKRYA